MSVQGSRAEAIALTEANGRKRYSSTMFFESLAFRFNNAKWSYILNFPSRKEGYDRPDDVCHERFARDCDIVVHTENGTKDN